MSSEEKNNLISYRCIYCGHEDKYSITKFTAHLEMYHKEITQRDKNELIKDLKYTIAKENRKLQHENNKRLQRIKAQSAAKELDDFKNKILSVLIRSKIDPKTLQVIKSRKSVEKLKRFIKFGLKKEFQLQLDKHSIDYNVPPKKSKRKMKKIQKDYFDKTEKSINVIYTPMGNKR